MRHVTTTKGVAVSAAGECITADPNQIDKYHPYRQHAPTSATTGTIARNRIVLLLV
jgi:hypothetical protein